jgi:hypothetical protein
MDCEHCLGARYLRVAGNGATVWMVCQQALPVDPLTESGRVAGGDVRVQARTGWVCAVA